MNQAKQDVAAAAPRKRMIKWVVVAFFIALAAVAVMSLPRGYSDDLSSIGKGKAALVLVRDKNAVQTFDLMEVMNGLRDQYAGQVEFLLTDFNTPQGRAFMAANKAPRATLVLLDAKGTLVNVIYPPQTAESLQQEIAVALKAAP